jgi:hypothetical protein
VKVLVPERRVQRIAEELAHVGDGLELHGASWRLSGRAILSNASQLALAVRRGECSPRTKGTDTLMHCALQGVCPLGSARGQASRRRPVSVRTRRTRGINMTVMYFGLYPGVS